MKKKPNITKFYDEAVVRRLIKRIHAQVKGNEYGGT